MVRTVPHKEIVTDGTRSAAGVLKDPPVINWKDMSGPITVDKNTFGIPPIPTTQFLTGTGSSASPISIGIQNIEGPSRSIIPQEARNSELFDVSIHRYPAKHMDPTPGWSKIIGNKVVINKSTDVYACRRMNFGNATVISNNPNFMNFGLSPVNTRDTLGSVILPTTRVGRPTNGSNWIRPGHVISEATVNGMSKTKAKNHYYFKSDFETMC